MNFFGLRLICLLLSLSGAVMLAGCAPVMETALDTTPLPGDAGAAIRPTTIVIATSELERTPELIDPAKLKETMEGVMRSSDLFPGASVVLSDVPGQGTGARMEIVLSRLNYSVQSIRMPPTPPCGFPLFAPFVAPALFQKNYLQLEAVAEGDVLFYDARNEPVYRFFLSENATGRANFFNSGGAAAKERLTGIALHNFSIRIIREFLYLTRNGTIATFL